MNDTKLYQCLATLWLHEPDEAALADAREIEPLASSLPNNAPTILAPAYADLFLLGVYPYGTVFTDPEGELNAADAQRVASVFEAHGYAPPELYEAGAPDHLGLCLGFLAHVPPSPPTPLPSREKGEGQRVEFLAELLAWAPVCCLAVEREPSAHPFYRALAQLTRDTMFADGRSLIANSHRVPPEAGSKDEGRKSQIAGRIPSSVVRRPSSDDDLRLRDIVRFLLAPARCGLFLSRARLGQMAVQLGTRLPFGSRFEVAEWLFAAAGERARVGLLLDALRDEAGEWAAVYRGWAERWPAWRLTSEEWLRRTGDTQRLLFDMQELAMIALQVEYSDGGGQS